MHRAIARQDFLQFGAWGVILGVAWLAYRPGLSGGFLFDDFVNLPSLGESGPIDDAATFWRYITSGTADPTGRPLSLLSFMLDARDWPASPAPFLRTNILLHLFNGTLLFLLLRLLGQVVGVEKHREHWAAMLAAAIWLLHPLLVSTTLYIVQREAMLPATFTLLGLLAFAHGRIRFADSDGRHGLPLMALGLALGTVLALLSKANGLLLPLLTWVLESTVFANANARSSLHFIWMKRLVVVLPSLVILAYLASFLPRWSAPVRDGWSTGERLLTQARVLVDYVQLLAVPRSVSTGLYNDGYAVSHSLINPIATLPCVLAVVCSLASALYWRKVVPVLCAAILFYFAGHVLESTVVPLELYFEHRNYLPSLLLAWPLARWIARAKLSPAIRTGISVVVISLLTITTWQRADIWGKPERLAELWARKNPDSSRAQATAAIEELTAGHPQRAMQRLDPIWARNPGDLQLALNYVNAACSAGGLSEGDLSRLSTALRTGQTGTLLVRQWLEKAIQVAKSGRCPGLDLAAFDQLLAAAQSNPAINTPTATEKSMPPLLGMLALERGDPSTALRNFDRALAANISPETAAGQASLLASRGFYREALAHLDTYERLKASVPPPPWGMPWVHQQVLDYQRYWPRELSRLRHNVESELSP